MKKSLLISLLLVGGALQLMANGMADKTKFLLDSVITDNFKYDYVEKNLYTYDAHGNVLTDTYFSLSNGKWTYSSMHEFTNNEDNLPLTETSYSWNSDHALWECRFKSESTYDANGKLLTYIVSNWKTDLGAWVNYNAIIYSYDIHGNLLVETQQDWDTEKQTWTNSGKKEYSSYDEYGNYALYVFSIWDDEENKWIQNTKRVLTFNEQGKWLSETYYTWAPELGIWRNREESVQTFDADGNPIETIRREWNIEASEWRNYSKEERIYNELGQILKYMYIKWNADMETWTLNNNSYKVEYGYDEHGNRTEIDKYDWTESQAAWEHCYRTTYYYSEHVIEGIESVAGDPSSVSRKQIRNGQVLIIRGDKTYTVTGAEVK